MSTRLKRNRSWCFTSFDFVWTTIPSEDEFLGICGRIDQCKYLTGQIEETTCGRIHFQGYVEFKHAIHFHTVKRRIGGDPHVEIRSGSRSDAINYCHKEYTRIRGPWTYPVGCELDDYGGRRTDIERGVDLVQNGGIRELVEAEPTLFVRYHRGWYAYQTELLRARVTPWRSLQVRLLWGEPGVGKTRTIYERHPTGMYRMCIPSSGAEWWQDYCGQEIILFDDFYGQIPCNWLLQLLDGYPLLLPVKLGHVYALWTTVYFTSNVHWTEWYPKHFEKIPKHRAALERRFSQVTWIGGDVNNALRG